MRKIYPCKVCKGFNHFLLGRGYFSAPNTKNMQTLQTLYGYIFMILQVFPNKVCDFTVFDTFFPAGVINFFSLVCR